MSILTAVYAEYANKTKQEWVSQLLAARVDQNWDMVDKLIADMLHFQFTE